MTEQHTRRGLIRYGISVLSVAGALLASAGLSAQGSPSGNASRLLASAAAAFSGGQQLQQVELTGYATWHSGSLEDQGNVTLTASKSGSARMHLQLGTLGSKSESQSGKGFRTTCAWASSNGVAHSQLSGVCRKPMLWFLPAFSLQASQLGSHEQFVDLGEGQVGSAEAVYRHLHGQYVSQDPSSSIAAELAPRTSVDLGLDPNTLLPAVLAYSVQPDNGAPISIAIEIRYSDYRTVNGAQIPFRIERFVNNSLQLEISVASAQLN